MTTNEELTRISMKDDVTTNDETEQQLSELRNLLKLPPEELIYHYLYAVVELKN